MSKVLTATPKPSIVNIGTEPTPLPAEPLEDRCKIMIMNTSDVNLLITDDEGTATFPVLPNNSISFNAPENIIIYAKVASGTKNISILELKVV
jgi:hypothetical protein